MNTLILDIKTVIAAYDQEVWYLLYRYDQEFRDYAVTDHAICRFIELFTVETARLYSTKYRLFGLLHRCDLPAVVRTDGEQHWYRRGQRHRDNDLPAIIGAESLYQSWYQHGQLHRDNDLPAIIVVYGSQQWYQRGQLHRCDLPAIIYSDGTQRWYQHGKHYRCSLPDTIRLSRDSYRR